MRAKDVGPLPRYLLSDDAYKKRNELLDIAVKELAKDPHMIREVLASRGMASKENSIPGIIFAVFADVQEFKDNAQDDRLLGYGYDGQTGVLFTEKRLVYMSDRVVNEIFKKNHDTFKKDETLVALR